METETLSSYEQSQDKHVLDDSMDVNIPRDVSDEERDSLESKQISGANSTIQHKEARNNDTDGLDELTGFDSSENKENENDSDQSLTNSLEDYLDNKLDSDYVEDEPLEEDKELTESEDANKSLNEDELRNVDDHDDVEDPLSVESKGLSNDEENDVLNEEERDSERESSNGEEKESLNNDEKELLTDEEKDLLSDEERDTVVDVEKDSSNNEENNIERVLLDDEERDSFNDEENQNCDDPLHAENQTVDNLGNDMENQTDDDPLADDKQKDDNEKSEDSFQHDEKNKDPLEQVGIEGEKMEDGKAHVQSDLNKEIQNEDCQLKDKENNEKIEDGQTDENEKIVDIIDDPKESDLKSGENTESLEETKYEKNKDVIKDCPLLKETLTKVKNGSDLQKEPDAENGMEDMEMDDDFDPSLLCPDIAMEVDEAPVITNSEIVPNDGSKSPLLYEPIFSTYVDEMTGAEVSFNLTPEEQQLRQQTYGEDNPIQYTKVHCTACNVHLGSALDGQSNRFVHPLLKVLICKDCYHFYTSGEFEKDEDGSELYCRWCGQGGQVMCCSGCEMVFCKKCVRINFGRKKLTEIRDSDDWFCFRCNPSQLISLRVHCAEFMEYVRREISRAATLENATSFMTTDFTQCCLSQKKKYSEPHQNEPKKKKRKSSIDPDYDPYREQVSPQPSTSGVKTEAKPVPILPKPMDPNHNGGVVTQVSSSTTLFKVGNTIFRPRAATFSQPRPRVQPVTSAPVIRQSSGPGYIKIMPGGIRVTPTPSRTQTAQTFVSSSSSRPQPSFHQRPPRPVNNANSQMKHEWFEKTVRAAARVNSNLSYTLTQLNRAQATATSVEALAVVHNKLQEILSTSINSLIQIRKNLRTEFIAGIKNIRFPSNKPLQPQPSTSNQDDDVIFISPSPSPVPPPMTPLPASLSPITSIQLPPSVSLTKRISPPGPIDLDSIPSTSNFGAMDKPKIFLRVKSLTALQNVTSECITIPDDPLPPPPPLTPIKQTQDVTIIDDTPEDNDVGIVIKDVTSVIETDPLQGNKGENLQTNMEEKSKDINQKDTTAADVIMNGNENEQSPIEADKSNKVNESMDDLRISYNLKDHPSPEVKKMLSTKVYIKRSDEIDKLVKNTFGLVNGNASE